MAALILPHRWRQQPQGPVGIDWGNPLTAGLLDAILPAQMLTARGTVAAQGSGIITRVGSQVTAPSGGVTGLSGRSAGMARSHGNVTTRDTYGSLGAGLAPPFTHLGFYAHTAQTGNRFAGNYAIGASGFGFISNASHRAVVCGSFGNNIITGSAYQVGAPVVVAHVATPTSHALFADGVQQASAAIAGGYAAPTGLYGIGSDQAGTSSSAVDSYLFALWSRALSAGEIQALSENPWQIFRPVQRRIWLAGAGAGGSTYNDTLAESVAAAEAWATAQAVIAAISEAAAAGDAGSAVAAMPAALVESGAAADAVSSSASGTYNDTLTESLTAGDAVASAQVFAAALSESATGADTTGSTSPITGTVIETATAADALASIAVYNVPLFELANVSDNPDPGAPSGTSSVRPVLHRRR